MSFPKDDHELERALAEAYGPPPPADFEAWRSRHTEAVAGLDPERIAALTRRRVTLKRAVQVLAGAIVASAAVLGFVLLWDGGVVQPVSAMEKMVENVRKAKSYKCLMIDRTTYDYPNPGGPAGWESRMTTYWLAPGAERWDSRDVAFGAKSTAGAYRDPSRRPAEYLDRPLRQDVRACPGASAKPLE